MPLYGWMGEASRHSGTALDECTGARRAAGRAPGDLDRRLDGAGEGRGTGKVRTVERR